jgi:hypothetical protein
MDRDEINKRLGLTESQMDEIGEKYEMDVWKPGTFQKVFVGRPTLGDGETKTMTFKIPAATLFKIDDRASCLGVTRSQYVRDLIDKDLNLTSA